VKTPRELSRHAILSSTPGPGAVDAQWMKKLSRGARPTFVCTLSLALVAAARAGAGIAVLPRYLGDAEPALRRLPMTDEPSEPVWLTVHRDLRQTPRVRVLLDFLASSLKGDRLLLEGRTMASSKRR
jgi:DNA-binding transcriptional LysR family regulator